MRTKVVPQMVIPPASSGGEAMDLDQQNMGSGGEAGGMGEGSRLSKRRRIEDEPSAGKENDSNRASEDSPAPRSRTTTPLSSPRRPSHLRPRPRPMYVSETSTAGDDMVDIGDGAGFSLMTSVLGR